MPDFPEMVEFPEGGILPNVTVATMHDCFGVLVAQDGDDLFGIHVHLALGPTPEDGFATCTITPEGARSVAAHLLYLAKYAELGIEAKRPNE